MGIAIYVDLGSYISIFYKTWIGTPQRKIKVQLLAMASDWPMLMRKGGYKVQTANCETCELMKCEPLCANHCYEPSEKMRTQENM